MIVEIETPCVKVCVVDPQTQLCIGCGRTRDEIAGWIGLNSEQRLDIMKSLDERLATLTSRKTRRGGRQGRLASLS